MSILKCSCDEDQRLACRNLLAQIKKQLHSLILRQIYAQLSYLYHTENQFQSNPQGAKIHASTTPCEYTCWPGVIGFPTILEYIHSINTTNGLIGVYTLFVCWLPLPSFWRPSSQCLPAPLAVPGVHLSMEGYCARYVQEELKNKWVKAKYAEISYYS